MKLRILLVDDNPPDRVRYRHMLRRAGEAYEVLEADCGEDALKLVDGTTACVLLDQDLPDLQGLDVLKSLRQLDDPPPVVMLTGEEDADVSVQALRLGAADYLIKRRIDDDRLLRAVHGAIERGRLERQLQERERQLSLFYRLANQTDDALLIADPNSGRIIECNESATARFGVMPTGEDEEPSALGSFWDIERWLRFLSETAVAGIGRVEWTVAGPTRSADTTFEILARRVDEAGVAYIVAVGRDVTSHKQQQRQLTERSRKDGLTGVLNRRALDEVVRGTWSAAVKSHQPIALLLADVDHFKAYNDSLGHLAGDDCLRAVATALSGAMREQHDLIGRYGGEEFLGVLPYTDLDGGIEVAERLLAAVRAVQLAHPECSTGPTVSVSIGVAGGFASEHQNLDDLVHAADVAMYHAKRGGRDRVASLRFD